MREMEDIVVAIEQTRHHSIYLREEPKHYVIDDVKILPPKMIFADAYDGKIFKQSLRIMNCGKYPAFVRVMPPSSKTFKIKSVPRGVLLPSGLSLTRKVLYTHTTAMGLPQACLYIHINEKAIFYELEVRLISSYVSLKPRVVYFGEVDVGSASKAVSVELKNCGRKIAHFAVDLGRHDLELIVEPMKGTIAPSKSVDIRVEVLGSYLGGFNKEFWIKTHPPQQVNICGTFIPAKLVLDHPFTTFSIAMMEFPRTYFGAESIKTLVIHNSSSTNAMFCTVAEYGNNIDYLDTVRATSNDLKCFYIKPKEGRLASQQKHTLRYSFMPRKIQNFDQDFCMAFVKVVKVHYRDGVIVEKDVEVRTFPSMMDLGKYSVESLVPSGEYDLNKTFESNFVRICLYGEMEDASVKLTPNSIYLNHLKPYEVYNQTLCIQNNSVNLPIAIKYIKEVCIEIVPSEVVLGPSGSVEINVLIKPSKIGQSCHKVMFDLVYHSLDKHYKVGKASLSIQYTASKTPPNIEPKFNMGITPMLTNEVGYLVNDVRFNTIVDKPRQAIVDKNLKCFNCNKNDLIAFPNDRPKSLRPWRGTDQSCTIFANLPRLVTEVDDYTLNTKETEMKKLTRNTYATYIQSIAQVRKLRKLSENRLPAEYLDHRKHLLLKGVSCKESITEISNPKNFNMDMPLPPEQLMGVIVTPKHVQLGMIAPNTSCTEYFTIQNKNDYYIDVSIQALNNSVVIKEKKEMRIAPKHVKNILFDCFSNGLGEYYVPVFIIINKYHIFDATVFAKVVPTTVACPYKKIVIDPATNESFFQIFNPVNCDITFSFEVQDLNFKVIPEYGTISPRKPIFCCIMFLPQKNAIIKTEIYLISQSGAKQIIKVILDNPKASVAFNTDLLKFENIPLNTPVTKEVVLRNFSDIQVTYMVSNSNEFEEITVKPREGNFTPKSDIHFHITAHFKHVVDFNCSIEFIIQDIYPYVVNIAGNVVFPKIKLEPKYIQIPKIVSGSYLRRIFRVTNISEAQSFITFPMQSYSEFVITDMDNKPLTKSITLEPNESRELYAKFNPPEPVAYSIYLPYIINGIIGPPVLNDIQSTKPRSYFKCTDLKFKSAVLPDILPTISIRCAAGARWLKFSSLRLNLFSFNNARINHFTITNISATDHEITISMVDKKYPFNIELERANNIISTENFYKVLIEPEEAVTFKVEFVPFKYGHYEVEIPIFVAKFFENCPFNFLKLSGTHPMPSIICKESHLCFQTIMVKEKIHERITLDVCYHKNDCKINAKVEKAESISVKFIEEVVLTQHHLTVCFLLSFEPKEECFVDCEVIFTCTCCSDSSCIVFVKASADDSTFASYPSLLLRIAASLSVVTKSSYPYFPKPTDNTFYASRMRSIQINIEKWLHSQGFFFRNFFKIPFGISGFPVEIKAGKGKLKHTPGQKTPPMLPLVQLLINLLDSSILKYFKADKVSLPSEDIEETLHVYTLYGNIIKFLKSQLVFVPQLKPEYLLPYFNYILFKNTFTDDSENNEKTFTEEEFNSYSKQCWIDLIMRIYKVFVLKRTLSSYIPKARSKLPQSPVIYHEEFTKYCCEHLCQIADRCENEAKLLLWLEFHFEKQKTVLWDPEVVKQHRKIRSFRDHLGDSLPFATLLLSYCPYMLNDLQNFYPDNQTNEQIFHNACLICIAWKKLQLSCLISPNAIVQPLVLEMLMLTTYLYDVLPSFYPRETITFEASLGSTAFSKVNLTNQSDVAISYKAIFFPNETDAFEIDSKTIVILPKKERKIKITFLAKSVLKRTAVLVLSGETPGYKFCKSMAITLIGIPQIFNFSEEFDITLDTFQKLRKRLEICSPYEKAYETDVYLYLGDQSTIPEDLTDFVSISSILEMNIPRSIIMEPMSSFDEDGWITFPVTLCYVTVGQFHYFIFFLNEEVGDFCIKLNINSVIPEEKTVNIEVVMPLYFNPSLNCICNSSAGLKGGMNMNCPQVVIINIPVRNKQIYDGLRLMLEICCGENDFAFWAPIIETTKGIRVLKMYMENTFHEKFISFRKILSPSVTYILEDDPNYVTAQKFTLPNVFTDKTYSLPVHWISKEMPEEGNLIITAEHGEEKRLYKLIFKLPVHRNSMRVDSIRTKKDSDTTK